MTLTCFGVEKENAVVLYFSKVGYVCKAVLWHLLVGEFPLTQASGHIGTHEHG